MTYIVHWKDITGNFTDRFVEIMKFLLYRSKQVPFEKASTEAQSRFGEDYKNFCYKFKLLEHAGYRQEGKLLYFNSIGWYSPYLERGELKFKTTAPPDRKYISLREYLEYRQKREQDAYEAEYYQEYSSILSDLCSDKGKCQTDDDVFVHEE